MAGGFLRLSRALQEARSDGVTSKMARAGNALLYRRFGRASENQEEAAKSMDKLSGRIASAGKQLPSISQRELMAALEDVEKARQRLDPVAKGKSGGREGREKLAENARRMDGLLERLGTELNEPGLNKMGSALGALAGSEDPAAGARRAAKVLGAASKILRVHLVRSELDRKFRLSRKTTVPPEKYRDLVEAYFKELSESE